MMKVECFVVIVLLFPLPQMIFSSCVDKIHDTFSCSWITEEKVEKRKKRWCKDKEEIDGMSVKKELCPLTCGYCSNTTTTVSNASTYPSMKGSFEPSFALSDQPSISAPPRTVPTVIPSLFPSHEPWSSLSSQNPTLVPRVSSSKKSSVLPTMVKSDSPTHFTSKSLTRDSQTDMPNAKPTLPPIVDFSLTPSVESTTGEPSTPSLDSTSGVECVDSTLRLKIVQDNVKITRSCKWVSSKNTYTRCKIPGVAAACPKTCNNCSICEDPKHDRILGIENGVLFKIEIGVKLKPRSCQWVAEVDTEVRCHLTQKICRSTCGAC